MKRVSYAAVFCVWLSFFSQPLPASELDDPRVNTIPELAGANWQYHGPLGPQNWRLIPKDETCADGQSQSPIAIEPGWGHIFSNITPQKHPTPIVPKWKSAPLQIVNNGHTIQVLHDPGSTVEVDGVEYNLTQFHFHSPSEHMVNGRQYPLEAHFVHTSSDPKHPGTAVIGVFLDHGYYGNGELAKIWKNVPMTVDPTKVVKVAGVEADPDGFLPPYFDYFRYEGSLTTPPCTEGVHWVLFTTPISASVAQLQKVQQWMNGANNRPIQSLNGRHVMAAHF